MKSDISLSFIEPIIILNDTRPHGYLRKASRSSTISACSSLILVLGKWEVGTTYPSTRTKQAYLSRIWKSPTDFRLSILSTLSTVTSFSNPKRVPQKGSFNPAVPFLFFLGATGILPRGNPVTILKFSERESNRLTGEENPNLVLLLNNQLARE